MIVLPKFTDIYVPEPIEMGMQLQGFYKFEAFNPETGKRRLLADWFPNLMLTAGLNRMPSLSTYGNYCRVGTGNTAPAATETALVTDATDGESAAQTVFTTTGSGSTAPYYASGTKKFTFPQALAANLSEVGVGDSIASGEPLLSRALILDGAGSPTTITVLAIEILEVTYELRSYGPTADLSGSVTIGGINYTTTTRLANINGTGDSNWQGDLYEKIEGAPTAWFNIAYNGNIGAVTAGPSGASGAASTSSAAAYSNLSFLRDYTVNWDTSSGNLTNGIRSVMVVISAGANWQIQFDGPSAEYIQKDNTKTLALTFRHTWAARP